MACKFCLTGVKAWIGIWRVHEIVTQIYELPKPRWRRSPISFSWGWASLYIILPTSLRPAEIFIDADGFAFSKRKVTVSTSGLVPAIDELGKRVDVSLAISLNASTDEQRSEIMPVNKKWNIEALLGACRRYPLGKHRRITFEYVHSPGGTMTSLEDAARLVKLVKGFPDKVNLIPFNEHPGSPYKRPSGRGGQGISASSLLDRGISLRRSGSPGVAISWRCVRAAAKYFRYGARGRKNTRTGART